MGLHGVYSDILVFVTSGLGPEAAKVQHERKHVPPNSVLCGLFFWSPPAFNVGSQPNACL